MESRAIYLLLIFLSASFSGYTYITLVSSFFINLLNISRFEKSDLLSTPITSYLYEGIKETTINFKGFS